MDSVSVSVSDSVSDLVLLKITWYRIWYRLKFYTGTGFGFGFDQCDFVSTGFGIGFDSGMDKVLDSVPALKYWFWEPLPGCHFTHRILVTS